MCAFVRHCSYYQLRDRHPGATPATLPTPFHEVSAHRQASKLGQLLWVCSCGYNPDLQSPGGDSPQFHKLQSFPGLALFSDPWSCSPLAPGAVPPGTGLFPQGEMMTCLLPQHYRYHTSQKLLILGVPQPTPPHTHHFAMFPPDHQTLSDPGYGEIGTSLAGAVVPSLNSTQTHLAQLAHLPTLITHRPSEGHTYSWCDGTPFSKLHAS